MTDTAVSFKNWIENTEPLMLKFWDFNDQILNLEMVDSCIDTLSHGEAIFLRFAIGVWSGINSRSFDIFRAAGVLEDKYRNAIADWFMNPFWP